MWEVLAGPWSRNGVWEAEDFPQAGKTVRVLRLEEPKS